MKMKDYYLYKPPHSIMFLLYSGNFFLYLKASGH